MAVNNDNNNNIPRCQVGCDSIGMGRATSSLRAWQGRFLTPELEKCC